MKAINNRNRRYVTLEAAPFIASWHPLVDGLDRIRNPRSSPTRLHNAIYRSVSQTFYEACAAVLFSSRLREVDRAIETLDPKTCKLRQSPADKIGGILKDIFTRGKSKLPSHTTEVTSEFSRATQERELPGRGRIFDRTNEMMVQKLVDLVWVEDPERVKYLSQLVSCGADGPLTIATLNYDNTIELAARNGGIPVDTGIDEWSRIGMFSLAPAGIRLLKLHGSIDWTLEDGQTDQNRLLPFQVISSASQPQMKERGYSPAIVFGRGNKLTAKGPYLDMLRVLEAEMDASETITVIGYSFRDEHINEFISQWINSKPNKKLRVINGPDFQHTDVSYAQQILRLPDDRREIIPVTASKGICQLFGKNIE